MDGFFIVDKQAGMSCQDVCYKIKKKFNLDKCGHNGTLDPEATGLMIVAVNRATKLIKHLENYSKAYIAKIVFGYNSDTLDFFGNITQDIEMSFDTVSLDKKIEEVRNLTMQVPPLTSAIKINGHKLWWYQKNNIDVDVPKRSVRIIDYKRLNEPVLVDNHIEVDIYLHVDKGYYIRSFARDLGEALDGCAILKELRRTKNGQFKIEQAKTLDELNIEDMVSIFELYNDLEILEVTPYIAKLVKNGVMLDERQLKTDKPFFVKSEDKIIAMYECASKYQYKPIIIFKEMLQ